MSSMLMCSSGGRSRSFSARAGSLGKRSMPAELLPDLPHTHHALDDAREQAVLFANLWEWPGPIRG
ncbi:hypothetical protein [Kitasatospora sp. NPDC094011]|uniref:hypothetical protein n=1 Tax=Kitasatospora sp. NPDC094011 TaxID=3364090 RepID=UPI00380F9F58